MDQEHSYDLPSDNEDRREGDIPLVEIKIEGGTMRVTLHDSNSFIILDESEARKLAMVLKTHVGWDTP